MPRTPNAITKPVRTLLKKIVTQPQAVFIDVTPVVGVAVSDCFPSVDRQIKVYGGSMCIGWQIWETPGIFVEAEFHAVWKNPEGDLIDITPKAGNDKRILFLPDPLRIYEGKQVNNVRMSVSNNPAVAEFLKTFDDEFELMNRGDRVTQHGQINVTDEELKELESIRKRRLIARSKI